MSEKMPNPLQRMYADQNIPEREKELFGQALEGIAENIYGYVTIADLEAVESVFKGCGFDVNLFNLLTTEEKWKEADEKLKEFGKWAKQIREYMDDGQSIMRVRSTHQETAKFYAKYFDSF